MKVFVVFKQGNHIIRRMWCHDLDDAQTVATILNDGLQPNARARGFHYTVEVEP